jgi:hypothetical protein
MNEVIVIEGQITLMSKKLWWFAISTNFLWSGMFSLPSISTLIPDNLNKTWKNGMHMRVLSAQRLQSTPL